MIDWQNVRVKLGDLTPWEHNPRSITKRQAAKLAESFDDFGQVETIAIGPDGEVYNGHQRLSVLLKLHGKDYEIDARQSSRPLSYDERRKLVVFLHAGATGEWNWDSLSAWNAADLQSWGFDDALLDGWKRDVASLGDMLESETPEPQDAEPQIDRAEELRVKWGVESGQLWQLGDHRLLCGDSTKREDVERVMGGEKAAHCVTSPPYFVGKEYERQFTENEILAFIDNVSDCVASVMQGNRRVVINCATTAWSHIGGNLDYRLNLDWWQSAFRGRGWLTRSIRIWSKHGGLVHNAPSADITDMHWEYLATFYNPKEKPHRGQNRVGDGWATSGIWEGIHGERQDVHSAPYPAIIPSRFIELYTDDLEIVFEPFSGSGTTIIACENLGRRCRAIEIAPQYVAVCLERMATAFPDLAIERIE